MAMIDRNFTFATNGTVTANDLHNLIDSATIYQDLITGQQPITSVGTNYELLIADGTNPNAAPNAVTVYDLFDDALSVGTYTGLNLTGALTYGTATGNRTVSTSATITNGTIQALTTGTTTSTNEVVTNGTITNLSATTSTFLGTITGSTNVVNIGSGQIYKDASGNVGIGNTSPSQLLTVGSPETPVISAAKVGVYSSGASLIITRDTTNDIETLIGTVTGTLNSVVGSATNHDLEFRTNNTERLRIDSSGNVGIGVTPTERLHVSGNAIITGDISQTNGLAAFARNSGGPAVTVTQSGVGAAATFTGGFVGIGMTPTAQLELSTDSAKKPSTNTWTIASDQRLKTNITNADNDRCYEIVKQVPLKRYTWRSEVYSEGQVKDRSKLGWIAQDVEAVFPKAVGTNRFAYNQVFEDVVTPELDSNGNTVLDENGVAKTKTEKRLVSEDVIEDCKDLNSDQIYAAMYGTIQKLIEKVEFLESKVATLEAA